jgi:hypothetical protein
MHVAKVEYGEAVEKRWQLFEHNNIALDENASCISASAPVETGQLKYISNDRMDRIPVHYVKGEEAVAEDLCLVVRLDTQSLSRLERSETLLQFAHDIFVHGTTSSEIGSTFRGSTRPPRIFRVFLSAYCLGAPTRGTKVPNHSDWIHEVKQDGFRLFTVPGK